MRGPLPAPEDIEYLARASRPRLKAEFMRRANCRPRWSCMSPRLLAALATLATLSTTTLTAVMCGICGYVRRTIGADARDVEAQLAAQRHRGPDAAGWFDGGRGMIGQNRLSIIDLVHGDPPITNEDRSVGVVLNGEIYNFRGLRARLQGEGHHFSSDGDTEVIAHLAEECDAVRTARELDGMFAFAVWDQRH